MFVFNIVDEIRFVWRVCELLNIEFATDWGNCRRRLAFSNNYVIVVIDFDTAENQPFK